MQLGLIAAALLLFPGHVLSYQPQANIPGDAGDLESYVTRPDLRPPKFDVSVFEPDLVSPGFWFVSPYTSLRDTDISTLYHPAQTGPHIYDAAGNLIWSGTHILDATRQAFDFRPIDVNGSQHLSLLVLPRKRSAFHPQGVGLLLDPSLSVYSEVHSGVGSGVENMHEFHVINNGRNALMLTFHDHAENVKVGNYNGVFLSVGNYGFVEVDVATGDTVFEWWSQGHIHVNETSTSIPTAYSGTWDWLHLNSVDKNQDGDYLISGRFTDTIYKVSGTDGSILWRLGGKSSSFQLDGFNFSAQHDARFRNADLNLANDDAYTYISFMDNAAGGSVRTSNHSMALIVRLDIITMTASLVSAYHRPDDDLTIARGNFQILPNSNRLAGWSENAYCTEFTPDGRRVLETSFTSSRMVTYRAYKGNFISRPAERPVMKGFAYGVSSTTSVSTLYASWNGATEIVKWKFWASQKAQETFDLVGVVNKTGFETNLVVPGFYERAYAEALAIDGTVLGKSAIEGLSQMASIGQHTASSDDSVVSTTLYSLLPQVTTTTPTELGVQNTLRKVGNRGGGRLIGVFIFLLLLAASSPVLLAKYRRVRLRRLYWWQVPRL